MREQFYEPEQFSGDPGLFLEETKPGLFYEDGHLSDAGLQALVSGQLDELGRLEAAEHLGFCPACLERYTRLLTGDVLQKPGADLAPTVAWRLRKKTMRINLRRYAAAAAAAAVALTLWGSGIFQQMTPEGGELLRPQPVAGPVRVEAPGAGVSGFVNGVLGAAGELCGGLFDQDPRPSGAAQGQTNLPQPDGAEDENLQDASQPDTLPAPETDARDHRADADRQHARWTPVSSQKPERAPATAMRGEE